MVQTIATTPEKKIALIAHDARKPDPLEWVRYNKDVLAQHTLYATGTTGTLIMEETGLDIIRAKSGPLGGDQQLGAMIAKTWNFSPRMVKIIRHHHLSDETMIKDKKP